MKPRFSLVGRAGFEPATNGLKGRYAISADCRFTVRAGRLGRVDGQFLHPFCQNPPTFSEQIASRL